MELLREHFGSLSDKRKNRRKLHSLSDIVSLCICGVICGEDDFVGIALWAQDNEAWLRAHLDLPHWIPSHDTLNRVFQLIDYQEFSQCFVSFSSSLCSRVAGEVVAIDGKCLRGSQDKGLGKDGIYMVGAWARDSQLVLGQEKVAEKSNEITAIPKLLEMLTLDGCVVTMDSMGTQTEIAERIVAKGADYVLAVKGNQPSLAEQVARSFATSPPAECYQSTTKDHGRIEIRTAEVIHDLRWIEQPQRWAQLRGIVRITSERTVVSEGKITVQTRYFIMSQAYSAQNALHYVRSHWAIENALHWSLDVTFGEDRNRNRTKNAAQNFAFIQRIALNLLKQEPSKISLKHKRHKAGRSNKYLLNVLSVDK